MFDPTHTSLSPILRGYPGFVNYKVYQLLAHGRWFSPGTPFFCTDKIDFLDETDIVENSIKH
jgi:hypothetical protein